LARAYTAGGFRVLGTAPTARAVRELKEEAGITQAWTLTRLALDLDADPSGFGTRPAVLILDEAGMASTRETARVLGHAAAARVKVIAIGDSGQLSSVQAGGWLGSLTRRLGSYELREVMRQRDPGERALLAHVRRGDPSEYLAEKTARGQLHIFSGDHETALAAERAAVAVWRDREAASPSGQAVLIARDNARRARLNALARSELERQGRLGESVFVAGHEFGVGDRVIARRNDRLRKVDNGMRGTIIAVDPTEQELLVRTDAGADRALDAQYVAEHLEHAYALTAHTIQGGTVDWAGVVGHPDDFTRNWSYTALSRARDATEIFLIDTPTEHQLDRAEIALDQPKELGDERPPLERLDAAMRRRDGEDLALDRIDSIASVAWGDISLPPASGNADAGNDLPPHSVDELRAELTQLRELARQPDPITDQLQAARHARAESHRVADEARARIADLEEPSRGVLRRRPSDPAALAFERERLKAAEQQLATAAERERNLAANTPDCTNPGAEHEALRERAASLEAKLSILRQQYVRNGIEHDAPHLTAELGPLPEQPHARHTWQQAARRIEVYRFDHAITDTDNALGPPPTATAARAHWQRVQQDIHKAQRELGLHVDRRLGHQL
jgi:hypothetical protein